MAKIDTNEQLIKLAKEAAQNSYSPYSNFPVGAAILCESGNMYSGCNVENASYGLTICAERTAVFKMAGGGDRKIVKVIIYTPTEKPTAPCGACRQVINEFGASAEIISVCEGEEIIKISLDQLLPLSFGPNDLV